MIEERGGGHISNPGTPRDRKRQCRESKDAKDIELCFLFLSNRSIGSRNVTNQEEIHKDRHGSTMLVYTRR